MSEQTKLAEKPPSVNELVEKYYSFCGEAPLWLDYPRNDVERAELFSIWAEIEWDHLNKVWLIPITRVDRSSGKAKAVTETRRINGDRMVTDLAQNFIRWLTAASGLIESHATRKVAVKEAVQAGNMPRIKAMIELVRVMQ